MEIVVDQTGNQFEPAATGYRGRRSQAQDGGAGRFPVLTLQGADSVIDPVREQDQKQVHGSKEIGPRLKFRGQLRYPEPVQHWRPVDAGPVPARR
jgi:hypothetical protein